MYKSIPCVDAAALMASGNLVVADVRDLASYEQEHVDQAIHLSISAMQDFCLNADKQHPILVYCYHGISSQSVAQHLADQGFSEVYSLIGGYEAWKQHSSSFD